MLIMQYGSKQLLSYSIKMSKIQIQIHESMIA